MEARTRVRTKVEQKEVQKKTIMQNGESIYDALDKLSQNMYATFEVKFYALVGQRIIPRFQCGINHDVSIYDFDECQVTPEQLAQIWKWMPSLIERSDREREKKFIEAAGFCYIPHSPL